MNENLDLIFFDKNSNEEIKKLIKNNGFLLCLEKIGEDYIISSINYSSGGYIFIENNILKGFVTFTTNINNSNLEIDIICANKNRGIGKCLMIQVIKFAKKHNFKTCELFAKNEGKLISFYENFNFITVREKPNDNNISCSIMRLTNDKYDDVLDKYNIINNITDSTISNNIEDTDEYNNRPKPPKPTSFLNQLHKK